MRVYFDQERGIIVFKEITFKKVWRFFKAWVLGVDYTVKIEGYVKTFVSEDEFSRKNIGRMSTYKRETKR